MKKLILIGFISMCFFYTSAQKRPEIDLESFIESLFSVQSEDFNYEDFYESLLMLYTRPIDLNKAGKQDLLSTYLLNAKQAQAIIDYRAKHGALLSVYELQAIPEIDLDVIKQLLPFVQVAEGLDGRSLWQRVKSEQQTYLISRSSWRLEQAAGFRDGRFVGNPLHQYVRFRTTHSQDFSIGFTAEKDPGEAFRFDQNQKGFDFYSGHIQIRRNRLLNQVIIGDYQAQFGQGLVFGAGFSPGKGAETVYTIRRFNTGLKPYTAVLESGFFRGTAATFQLQNIQVTVLASRLNQDGRPIADTTFTEFEEFITNIQSTGLHRTSTELAGRNQVLEQNLGFALTYRPLRNLTLGATGLNTTLEVPIKRRPNNYNQFEFNGKTNYLFSLFGEWNWQNISVFGESAQSSSGGTGNVAGVQIALSNQLDLAFHYRNYQKNFHSFYGNALSENSRIINEVGYYWGIKYRLNRKHQLAAYFDQFEFPWLKYRVEMPSSGYEWLMRYTYFPNRYSSLFVQYRAQLKQRTLTSSDQNLPILVDAIRENYIVQFDWRLTPAISIRTRVQGSSFELNAINTAGFAIMQDVYYKLNNWKFAARYALFDTDDFENRQYAYERDVLYAFSLPAYQGKGSRTYLLCQYNVSDKVAIWAKVGRFHFPNSVTLGSGLIQTEGPYRTDLRLQVMIKR